MLLPILVANSGIFSILGVRIASFFELARNQQRCLPAPGATIGWRKKGSSIMRNMKLAAKIGVGFGLVIVIAMALGAVAIMNMTAVHGDATRLSRETVPEITVANSIERSSLETMYNMRGYSLTQDQDYFTLAKQSLADVKISIAEAQRLADKHPRLFALKKNVGVAQAKVDEYSKLTDQTVTANMNILAERQAQDDAGASFMEACRKYLDSMTASLATDLAGRLDRTIIHNRVTNINQVHAVMDMGRALETASFKAQATGDSSILQKALEPFAQLQQKVDALTAITVQESNRQSLKAILDSGADYVASCNQVLTDLATMAQLNKDRGAAAQAVLDAAKATSIAGLKEADDITTLTEARLLSADMTLIVGLLIAALIGIAIAVAITRAITRPLSKGVAFAQLVAAGDFTRQLDIRQNDEVGVLAAALNGMSAKLQAMVAGVQDSADQVASSAEQITASAQKLSEGAQSQASTLEETGASIEELTASVDQVAGHAQSQAAAVAQGSTSMTQVQKSMEQVSTNLNEIANLARNSVENAADGARAVQHVVEGISLIATSSEKIGGIVTVISDIADQTNLLALNAAIEAARAGEHGRGFAVVADEVSKLADRSASSTKEIEGLIRESVKNVNEGVQTAVGSQKAMEQIRAASQQVNDMISSLSDSMSQQVAATHQLAAALGSVSEMSQSISAATEEQTTNARQVSRAVENVNEITQGAAAAAEQMSAATEQLAGMAQELQRLMSQFRIADQAGSAVAAGMPRDTVAAQGGAVAG